MMPVAWNHSVKKKKKSLMLVVIHCHYMDENKWGIFFILFSFCGPEKKEGYTALEQP